MIFDESRGSSLRVSVTLAPTLIFTLVLAGILRDRYAIPDALFGALLVYATVTTALPSFMPKGTAVDFDPGITMHETAVGEQETPPAETEIAPAAQSAKKGSILRALRG
jgi:hypothetical protein